MNENTFGALLGKLIYAKRKALGLTQIQLAEDAYGTSGKTRRISELESGQVANPHPKTIDPIIVALGISEAELEECATSATTTINETLEAAYADAENLLKRLAEQFEDRNPNASLAELDQFLSSKAEEYFTLKKKITEIEAFEAQISGLKQRAIDALAEGEYQLVDDLLREAEEVALASQTLSQISKQADLRILRGDNALLSGEIAECLKLYKSAALFFEPFDNSAMVLKFQELAGVLYETGRRSLDPVFWVCEDLLCEALKRLVPSENEPWVEGNIHYRLSLVLRNQHLHEPTCDQVSILEKAVKHARKAVLNLAKGGKKFDLISARISLGNCLSDLGRLKKSASIAEKAVEVFQEAKLEISDDGNLDVLLGHACGGLAAAILRVSPSYSPAGSRLLADVA